MLSEVDLAECRFAGMHRMDQLNFGGQCTFTRIAWRPAGAGPGDYWRATPRITLGQAAWGADARTSRSGGGRACASQVI